MKHILAFTLALAVLAPATADACSDHRRKPVHCTSYTNINGTTKSTCR
ncbi:hypothetical protein [Bradyrhizobium sp. USDA 10063]